MYLVPSVWCIVSSGCNSAGSRITKSGVCSSPQKPHLSKEVKKATMLTAKAGNRARIEIRVVGSSAKLNSLASNFDLTFLIS
jgi:hypothetical protein